MSKIDYDDYGHIVEEPTVLEKIKDKISNIPNDIKLPIETSQLRRKSKIKKITKALTSNQTLSDDEIRKFKSWVVCYDLTDGQFGPCLDKAISNKLEFLYNDVKLREAQIILSLYKGNYEERESNKSISLDKKVAVSLSGKESKDSNSIFKGINIVINGKPHKITSKEDNKKEYSNVEGE